jgi:transposase-like protein
MRNPFRYFNSSPEVIRLTVMMYIRYPLSLRQVEDLLFERGGIDICHETVRVLVEPFRSDVRQRDQETTPSSSVIFAMALAPG